MSSVAGGIDGLEAVFDDGSLVADAGLLLAGTVMDRLGLEALIDDTVRLGGSAGAGAGRKVLTVAASVLVGGRCIDDTDRLRSHPPTPKPPPRSRTGGFKPGSTARHHAGCGGATTAVAASGAVLPAVDCGDVLAVVHVRACAPARQSGRACAGAGVVCGRRAGRRGVDRGFGLHGV